MSLKKLGSLLAGASCFAILAPGAATAQTAPTSETTDDVIVIIGNYSAGLKRSLEVKREADVISDAVVAADIGKLPAANVAEALQRVPGVSIVREAGEGQFISVRGLGPNFQSVTLNGMPMAYNENIRNSGQSGRQFRLQVLPSDLIDGIVVQKTPTADLVEGGIGSSVDIRLLNPLERDSFVAASLVGSFEERTETTKPNGSLSAGWRNEDRTFGVFGGLSFSQRDVQFDRLVNGWSNATVAGLGTVRVPGDVQPYLELENRDRTSAVAGLQWKPAPNLEIGVDGFYSLFNNETTERRLTYYIPSTISRLDVTRAVVEDGRLVAGVINGGRIRNYAEYLDQAHENLQLNAELTWEAGGWTIAPRFSFASARSDLETPILRAQYRTGSSAGGVITWDFSGDPTDDAEVNAIFTSLDLTNPASVPFESLAVRPINSEDEDQTFVLDVSRDLDLKLGGVSLSEASFGLQASERFRDYQRRDRSAPVLRSGVTRTTDFIGTPVPANAFDQSIGVGQSWTSVNWPLFLQSYILAGEFDGINPSAFDLKPTAADLQNSYNIEESIQAAYARVNFGAAIAGRDLSGNAGLRYVTTDTSVDGTIVAPVISSTGSVTTQVTPSTTEGSYEAFLPSLNAKLEITDDLMLRFGLARTITRPSLSELRNSINTNSVTVTTIFNQGAAALNDPTLNRTASAGNPDLKPYASWNIDLSLEKYFTDFGAVSVAFFHKDIEDYIGSDAQTRTLAFAVNNGSTLPVDILVSSPVNLGDAKVSGVELGYNYKLPVGLGLSATATFTNSELELKKASGANVTAGMHGVSDTSFSITPFFERGPFEINLSYTYRGKYLTDSGSVVTSLPTEENALPYYQNGFGILDMGASVQVNPNFQVFFQAVNLLDQRQTSFAGDEAEFTQIHTFGRSVSLGARARF